MKEIEYLIVERRTEETNDEDLTYHCICPTLEAACKYVARTWPRVTVVGLEEWLYTGRGSWIIVELVPVVAE